MTLRYSRPLSAAAESRITIGTMLVFAPAWSRAVPVFGQLDLLEAIRDEDGDLQSFEIIIRAMFLLYAAFLKLPWGSMTNFLAAPLSKSL